MARRQRRAVVAALVLAAWVPVVAAHDFWIEATPARPQPGATVEVRLRVGEHLRGEPVARRADHVERFVVVGPAGPRTIAGVEGRDPAGYLRMAEPGMHVVGYRSRRSRVETPPELFEAYLFAEGLEHVVATRALERTAGTPGREVYSRCAKALVPVATSSRDGAPPRAAGAPPRAPVAPAAGVDRVLGFTLELVPEADPHALPPGAALPLRVLHEGQPLAGALVVALRRGDPSRRRAARTDGEGRVALMVSEPDFWLVKTVHMVRAPAGVEADWESFWASLTFDASSASPAGAMPGVSPAP